MKAKEANLGLSGFLGSPYVLPTGRGSLGIWAALRAWGGNGPVAVQATVCQDVVAAILMAGREPIFCDVDPATGLAPVSEWRRAHGLGANSAIVVHLYGNPADTQIVRSIFEHGLVIDDAAQALGAVTTTGFAGTGGDVGVVSFGPTKQIEVGGAALIFNDREFAESCSAQLATVAAASEAERALVVNNFRIRFEAAREKLRTYGDSQGFEGLLAGYSAALRVAWNPNWAPQIAQRVRQYPQLLAARREKMAIWGEITEKIGFVRVGMTPNAAPWRFACRLPECTWRRQHEIGTSLRQHGIHVSHWYLPANWLMSSAADRHVCTEQLARESFQFWLDENTEIASIRKAGEILKQVLSLEEGSN